MILNINKKTVVVFDLDDTLYNELDFVKSAYKHIAKLIKPQTGRSIYNEMLNHFFNNELAFELIIKKYQINVTVKDLLNEYRNHQPKIRLKKGLEKLLPHLKKEKIPVCLLTDGRSSSQRNKTKALGLDSYFDMIVISEETGYEKPKEYNYKIIEKRFPGYQYIYFGDNFTKDFIAPNKLNWLTIGLRDKGENIHKQDFSLPIDFLPLIIIDSFNEIHFNITL